MASKGKKEDDHMVVQVGLRDANFPKDESGRVYHVGVKPGEVANRVVTVGSTPRAQRMAACLDGFPDKVNTLSHYRGYVVHTGRFHGVPVSIIASGMGIGMVDIMIREVRAVVEGPLVMVRYGTCGCLRDDVDIGSVVVQSKAICVLRNSDDWLHPETREPYLMSQPICAHEDLSRIVKEELKNALGANTVQEGLDVTADSFYGSQGRCDPHFEDRNDTLLDDILAKYPDTITLEMENFTLFHLASCCRLPFFAAGAGIVLAQRRSNAFLDKATLERLEVEGGRAVLEGVTKFPLEESQLMHGPTCVWE